MPSLETAARSLKVAPITATVHSDVEIETAIMFDPDNAAPFVPSFETAARSLKVVSITAPVHSDDMGLGII